MVMTKEKIELLDSGQTVWDKRVPGFGARKQTAGGSTSFILKLRIRRKQKLLTLGRYGILTIEQARAKAIDILRENLSDNLSVKKLSKDAEQKFFAWLDSLEKQLREAAERSRSHP